MNILTQTKSVLSSSLGVRLFGYLFLLTGLFGIAMDEIGRSFYSHPFNLGIVLGNAAIGMVGVIALMVARQLKTLEQRLEKLEKDR